MASARERHRRLRAGLVLGWVLGALTGGTAPVALADPDPVVIAAVGDIACQSLSQGQGAGACQSDRVADLVTEIDPDRFLALGDLQYSNGTLAEFLRVWDVQFGHLNDVIAPAPGNHEYGTPDAQGYFDYFESRGVPVGAPHGYYSFELGGWHVVSLNSDVCGDEPGCGPGTPQYEWLAEDLRLSGADCTLAFMHHPPFDWRPWNKWVDPDDTTPNGGTETEPYRELWRLMDGAGVDVLLAAHNHLYQRWAPQDADGNLDPDGIVQYTVGTGGRSLYPFGKRPERPENLVATQNRSFGVLQMTLHDGGYDHEFVPSAGEAPYDDAGSGTCV